MSGSIGHIVISRPHPQTCATARLNVKDLFEDSRGRTNDFIRISVGFGFSEEIAA